MAQQQSAKPIWASRNDPDATIDDAEAIGTAFEGYTDYARAFQQRLVEAYGPQVDEQKLPVPQRLAVILALTGALWMMVGLALVVTL
jgi:hypothetical protein